MNPHTIVTIYVVIDDLLKEVGHKSDVRAWVSDAEILTVAVVSAKYFQSQHERCLYLLTASGYVSYRLSSSWFNRRLHQLSGWLVFILEMLCALAADGETFIIDSMPLPVCRRVRASRCRKVSGRAYCGYCAAKKETFYGYRLHLVCTAQGIPVAFQILPAFFHDLTPLEELLSDLPAGARVAAEKAYLSAVLTARILTESGVILLAARRNNMSPHAPADESFIRTHRRRIETLNSQLEAMGTNACTHAPSMAFSLKSMRRFWHSSVPF